MLDVDATHVPLHSDQEHGHFHAYDDNYCYLPLHLFAGQDMLACVLCPSDSDPASVVNPLIKRLLVPLRRAWPKTKIIVRADSGFCRPRVLQSLERWGAVHQWAAEEFALGPAGELGRFGVGRAVRGQANQAAHVG